MSVLKDSRQYVQGVAWDPLGKVIVTLSNDRYVCTSILPGYLRIEFDALLFSCRNLRVYGIESKFRCLHSICKLSLPDQVNETYVQRFSGCLTQNLSMVQN